MEYSRAPVLDDSGRIVAFASPHPIGERDQAHDEDLYVALMAKPPSLTGVKDHSSWTFPSFPIRAPVARRPGLH
jgi:hypothetical protein